MKISKEKIQEIADWVRENGLVDYGGATIKSMCEQNGIGRDAYYRWLKTNTTFANAIKKAKAEFKSNLEPDLVRSLAKAAKGYTFTKRRTEYGGKADGSPVIKKQIVETVDVAPNVGAAIFLLTNIAPQRWKNKINNDVNAEVKADVAGDMRYSCDLSDDVIFKLADEMQEQEHEKVMAEREEPI